MGIGKRRAGLMDAMGREGNRLDRRVGWNGEHVAVFATDRYVPAAKNTFAGQPGRGCQHVSPQLGESARLEGLGGLPGIQNKMTVKLSAAMDSCHV